MTKSYTLLLVSVLMLISCSEDDTKLSSQKIDSNVELARDWFNFSSQSPLKDQLSNKRTAFKSKKILWDEGVSYIKDERMTIEVPLFYDSNISGRLDNDVQSENYKNLTKLILIKHGDSYEVYIMRVMPDTNSVSSLERNSYDIKEGNFSGSILYSDWCENPLVYVKYENGVRTEKLFVSKKSTDGRLLGYVCDFVTVSWYQVACSAYGCTESYLGSDTYYICVQSNQDQSLEPPDGDLGGGGSGGGSNPIDPNDLDLNELWEEEKIIDQNLRACMQTIMSDLKNLTQGSVGKIIQKFSGNTPGYNWEVKDGNLAIPGSPTPGGQTSPIYNKATGNSNYNI